MGKSLQGKTALCEKSLRRLFAIQYYFNLANLQAKVTFRYSFIIMNTGDKTLSRQRSALKCSKYGFSEMFSKSAILCF